MSNIEKKLDALIDVLGFDVEEVEEQSISTGQIIVAHDYKLTKRDSNGVDEFCADIWRRHEEANLVDGQMYKFNYKSKNAKYDNCVMTYRKPIRKFACFKYLLDLEFCSDFEAVVVGGMVE